MNRTITIGRFEPKHCILPESGRKIRIRDIKVKRKPRVRYLFATGTAIYEIEPFSGTVRSFFPPFAKKSDVLVLADEKQRKKAEKFLRKGRTTTLTEWLGMGKSLEESYASIFSKSDPVDAYMKILKELDSMRMLDLSYFSLGKLMRKIVILKHKRKFGESKSSLEEYWRNVPTYTFSEAFAFERRGRIVSYDVNSMFPHILTLPIFSDPRRLRRVKGADSLKAVMEAGNGIARVRIRPVTKYGKTLAPLYYREGGVSHQILWRNDDVLDVWLTRSELKAYEKDFEITEAVESVFSPRPFSTGLSDYIAFLYSKRDTEDPLLKRAVKNALVYLHASYLGYSERRFVAGDERHRRHCERYGLYPEGEYPFRKFLFADERGNVHISERVLNLEYGAESLFFTAVAHSRALLYSAVRKIAEAGGEICYVNVDSVHVRFEEERAEKRVDEILGVGTGLGKWKKDATADHGVWVDPGVYYLFEKGKPVKISIPFSKEKRENKPFQRFTKRYEEKIGRELVFELFGGLRYAKEITGRDQIRVPSSRIGCDLLEESVARWKRNSGKFARKHEEMRNLYSSSSKLMTGIAGTLF